MFVLLQWIRSYLWLISYVAAVTANCCQHENGGKKIPNTVEARLSGTR
jgi:hypothetical protein